MIKYNIFSCDAIFSTKQNVSCPLYVRITLREIFKSKVSDNKVMRKLSYQNSKEIMRFIIKWKGELNRNIKNTKRSDV